MPPDAVADLALHSPIALSEVGPSVSDSVIFSGVASRAAILCGYPQGDAEVAGTARADTADGLIHVPVVDPVDHQRWTEAVRAGRPYEETPLGTVIAADLDGDMVPFRMVLHSQDAIRKVRTGEWPEVSVAYIADFGRPTRPDADFAQVARKVRHLALVPKGRDPYAQIVRDAAADAAGVHAMTLEELKLKHPALYAKARKALRVSRRAGVAMADAVSLDKAIPLIKELMADDVGKLVLHALVNAPAEMAEIEQGAEEMDGMDPAAMEAMADARAAAAVAPLLTRLAAVEGRFAAADAAANQDALRTRARKTADALNRAGVKAPEGFDPANPTVAMCDAAQDLLVDAFANPSPTLGARKPDTTRWQGDGTRATADASPRIHHIKQVG